MPTGRGPPGTPAGPVGHCGSPPSAVVAERNWAITVRAPPRNLSHFRSSPEQQPTRPRGLPTPDRAGQARMRSPGGTCTPPVVPRAGQPAAGPSTTTWLRPRPLPGACPPHGPRRVSPAAPRLARPCGAVRAGRPPHTPGPRPTPAPPIRPVRRPRRGCSHGVLDGRLHQALDGCTEGCTESCSTHFARRGVCPGRALWASPCPSPTPLSHAIAVGKRPPCAGPCCPRSRFRFESPLGSSSGSSLGSRFEFRFGSRSIRAVRC